MKWKGTATSGDDPQVICYDIASTCILLVQHKGLYNTPAQRLQPVMSKLDRTFSLLFTSLKAATKSPLNLVWGYRIQYKSDITGACNNNFYASGQMTGSATAVSQRAVPHTFFWWWPEIVQIITLHGQIRSISFAKFPVMAKYCFRS